jgi:hypothetical protein
MQKQVQVRKVVRRRVTPFAPIIKMFRGFHKWAELDSKLDFFFFYGFLAVLTHGFILRGLKVIIDFLVGGLN